MVVIELGDGDSGGGAGKIVVVELGMWWWEMIGVGCPVMIFMGSVCMQD